MIVILTDQDAKESPILRLNLGCGRKLTPGYFNVDLQPPADILHDLNEYPWPFKDSTVSEIRAWHIVEHLDDPMKFMKEIWRICKPGAIVEIQVPWWKMHSILWNPEHKHDFRPEWFKSFDPQLKEHKRVYKSFGDAPKETFKFLGMKKLKLPYRLICWLPKVKVFRTIELHLTLKATKGMVG